MQKIFLLAVALLFITLPSFTQCAFTVNSFPYNESFESSAGGWVSGGTNNDWAMGTPNKAYIQSAGAGNTCWVTGSLTGSFYNFAQRSFVYSPCFDFTNLQKPFVKFKIYWEGENQYDGACFNILPIAVLRGIMWAPLMTRSIALIKIGSIYPISPT